MMRQQWFPAMLLAVIGAAALAGTAGSGQDADRITVTSDPQVRETTYTGVSGPCRVDWVISGVEINRGVVRHRSRCSLPLPEQIPLISAVMDRVLQDARGADGVTHQPGTTRHEFVLLDRKGEELLNIGDPLEPPGRYQRFLESIPRWTGLPVQDIFK
jgi:hypothetical protein